MRTKYDASCVTCAKLVKKGEGFLHRKNGKWFAHCLECHDSKPSNQHKGDVKMRQIEKLKGEVR